jgi:Fe2+ transport system protein FeoA
MRCQLCGYEYDATDMGCHTECPMGSRCNLICCPNCGYQVVDESKSMLAKFLHRLWPSSSDQKSPQYPRRLSQNGISVVPLTHIPVGWQVEVQRLGDMPSRRLTHLSIFGLTPGGIVEVLQHRPGPVIRIGETELALGKEILEQIWVRPDDKSA